MDMTYDNFNSRTHELNLKIRIFIYQPVGDNSLPKESILFRMLQIKF